MAETRVMNCIMCPMGCEMTVTVENGKVIDVKGNTCPRGAKYANDEVTAPKRMLTTTVRIEAHDIHSCLVQRVDKLDLATLVGNCSNNLRML